MEVSNIAEFVHCCVGPRCYIQELKESKKYKYILLELRS